MSFGGVDPAVSQAIFAAAGRYGIDPIAMMATAYAESGLRNDATSTANAQGLFQFIPSTWSGSSRAAGFGGRSPTDPVANAMTAAHDMASLGLTIANGYRGARAVDAMVNRFERPGAAGAAGDMSRALPWLAQHAGGTPPPGGVAPAPVSSTGGATSPTPAVPGVNLSALAMQGTQDTQNRINQNNRLAGLPDEAGLTIPTPPMINTPAPAAAAASLTPSVPSATQMPASAPGTYTNPLKGFGVGRIDMGLDATGAGRIGAIGNAVITRVSAQNTGTGWPGAGDAGRGNRGAIVVYKLLDGPNAGRYVYLAENIDPLVRVGDRVNAGQAIANARGSFPYLEMGWAAGPSGQTLASATTGYTEGQQTQAGKSFAALMHRLGFG